MDTVYLVSLIVGGFFVLLSIFGGGDAEADVDVDFDADVDADVDFDAGGGTDLVVGADAGPGLVDLFSLRALFLFAAFFGLTGTLLTWIDNGEPATLIAAVLMGLFAGLGGNYILKRFAYEHVSSDVGVRDLQGRTATVVLPFGTHDKGKVSVVAKGHRLQLVARGLEGSDETFHPGEEVVILRMNGRIAEVVKPT